MNHAMPTRHEPRLIETARLRLRRWRSHDAAAFAAMNADPEVMAYFPGLLTPSQARLAIAVFEENFTLHGYSFWAVEMKKNKEFIGIAGLEPCRLAMPETAARVAMGWTLARPYWGQGLAHEAALALIDDAAGRLALSEIFALTHATNLRSVRLCERLGMEYIAQQPAPEGLWPLGHPLQAQVVYRRVL